MEKIFSGRISRWLLPVVLILFILQVLTLPFVLGFTYSGRSEAPDHILTYTENKLTWDDATGIGGNGEAQLKVFEAEYPAVSAADGADVVAPGTDGFHIVRLKNGVQGAVSYTAVLYRIVTDETLPVDTALEGSGFADTTSYPLPQGVNEEDVIRAVSGTVNGGTIQDFDIRWLWEFETDEARDAADTLLGNKADADQVTVGLYIVIQDENSYVIPETPKTGDGSHVAFFATLMIISALLLVLLLMDRRRERLAQ